jgi:hypothetical protein
MSVSAAQFNVPVMRRAYISLRVVPATIAIE